MEQAIEERRKIAPKQAPELQRELGISQPTVSRTLTKLEKQRRIVRVGNARSTRYAALRPVALLPDTTLPVYEAEKAESGEPVGSSAGGEQPKFTTFPQGAKTAAPVHAIVKFSAAAKNDAAARWRDMRRALP